MTGKKEFPVGRQYDNEDTCGRGLKSRTKSFGGGSRERR